MTAGIADADTDATSVDRTESARRILIEAALLGVLADGAIRNAPDGLGWTLWVISLVLAAANVARRRGASISREQQTWLWVAVACAAAFAWRDAGELRLLNVFGTLVAIAMFSMAASGLPVASILVARLRDVAAVGVYAVRDMAVGAPMLVARDAELQSLPAVRGGASWSVLRSILLTIPLVLVFSVLLSRADPVFASLFSLPSIDTELVFSHVVIAGIFAWLSAGWIRGALLGAASRPVLPQRIPLRLGLAEVTTSLGATIALFTVFVALQIRWLFGGAEIVLATTGLTVAEYARRGFFELLAVAMLVLPLILGTGAAIEDEAVEQRHRRLSLVLVGLVAAIMASALLRMRLYVGYFGLTTDRLYATAMMAWLGLVFGAMALTLLRGWARPFAAATVFSAFLTLLALNTIDPERLVARVNLGRDPGSRVVDYAYLARLSGDAMPTVARALHAAAPSPDACKAGRFVRERWVARQNEQWNLGTWRGRSAVMSELSPATLARLCAGEPATAQGAATARDQVPR